jgi:uncharacterized protein YciI
MFPRHVFPRRATKAKPKFVGFTLLVCLAMGTLVGSLMANAALAEPAAQTPAKTFMMMYSYVPDMAERRQPYRGDHLSRLEQARDEGKLSLAGGFGDPVSGAVDGALLLIAADGPGEVLAWAGEDPYAHAGLIRAVEIREVNVAVAATPTASTTVKTYMLTYSYVPDMAERRQPYRGDHLTRLEQARDEGKLSLACGFGDPVSGAVDGALLLVAANGPSEVLDWAANDPYAQAGLIQGVQIRELNVAVRR